MVNFKLVPPVAAALLLAVSVGHTAENEPGYKASAEHGFDLKRIPIILKHSLHA